MFEKHGFQKGFDCIEEIRVEVLKYGRELDFESLLYYYGFYTMEYPEC